MYQVIFTFENGATPVTATAAPGETLLETARAANVAIDAPCSGNGSCGKCRVKLLEGTQGIGVVLCETQKAAESVIEAFIQTNNNILVQEYIREANGADIRCLVVNGKVVAAMRRQAQPGEFRSNLHRGGTAEAIKITPEERATAVQAAKIMGLDVAGVDILRSARGPLVLEVNSSPGLQGVEAASGKDVAGKIIEFLELKASRKHKPAE